MNLSVLMGGGLSKSDSEEGSDESESYDDDDETLEQLGAKYGERFAEAVKSGDGPEIFRLFCRINELCEFMESKERGY